MLQARTNQQPASKGDPSVPLLGRCCLLQTPCKNLPSPETCWRSMIRPRVKTALRILTATVRRPLSDHKLPVIRLLLVGGEIMIPVVWAIVLRGKVQPGSGPRAIHFKTQWVLADGTHPMPAAVAHVSAPAVAHDPELHTCLGVYAPAREGDDVVEVPLSAIWLSLVGDVTARQGAKADAVHGAGDRPPLEYLGFHLVDWTLHLHRPVLVDEVLGVVGHWVALAREVAIGNIAVHALAHLAAVLILCLIGLARLVRHPVLVHVPVHPLWRPTGFAIPSHVGGAVDNLLARDQNVWPSTPPRDLDSVGDGTDRAVQEARPAVVGDVLVEVHGNKIASRHIAPVPLTRQLVLFDGGVRQRTPHR
mmetsp:Transcript_27339/g.71562  ORF Transcript_27339/g.71562 Transcript_27339/m.71562 type:complete len:362 (+) Transcript_27339:73-1158(+)